MKREELMLRLNTARGLEIPASVCVKKTLAHDQSSGEYGTKTLLT